MKASKDDIRGTRQLRKGTILVTGVTGFLGSHLMVELLRRGYPVIAVCRPKGGIGAADRVGRLLKWFHMEGKETRREHYPFVNKNR